MNKTDFIAATETALARYAGRTFASPAAKKAFKAALFSDLCAGFPEGDIVEKETYASRFGMVYAGDVRRGPVVPRWAAPLFKARFARTFAA